MVPHTRRRFLHVATAGIGAVAGCGRLTGDTVRSSDTAHEADGPTGQTSGSETDPPALRLRADTELPPLRVTDPDRRTTEALRPELSHPRDAREVITSQSRSDRLTVAGDVDEDRVSSFVSATNFDSETLFLETNRVRECFRLILCHVSWQPSRIATDYVRRLRPYDERCAADERVLESWLVRLPVTLDEDSVNSYATSIGGGGRCNGTGAARAGSSSRSADPAATPPRTTEGDER